MATLQDIADVVGVSKVTVSKVLRGKVKGSYPRSAAQAERIRKVAKELGYRVDWRARALKTKRTNMIGLLSTDKLATHTHDPEILAGLVEVFGSAGYHLVFVRVGEGTSGRDFADARFDGLIIDYHIDPEELEIIQQAQLPAVVINAPSPADGIISVMPDHFEAGALAARHLLELGHRRIGFVDSSESEQAIWPRHMIGQWRAGIRREMKQAGCLDAFIDIEPRNGTETETPETYQPLFDQLLAGPDRLTALIANNGDRAVDVALGLSRRMGLRCPEDVSILCMVDEKAMPWCNPPITSVKMPFLALGREAAAQLIAGIEADGGDRSTENPPAVKYPLEPKLIVRDSTSSPPTGDL
ncbi:MAG: LacI family DNA-binding transcriptional regulator [Planctomycetota bacterium]